MTLILLSVARNQEPILLGDINNDKLIDDLDVQIVQQYLLRTAKLSKKEQIRADMNFDGEITILDLLKIKKIILEEGD